MHGATTSVLAYVVDELVDVVIVSITGPRSIVCASVKGLYVLQWCTTCLNGLNSMNKNTNAIIMHYPQPGRVPSSSLMG